MKKNLIIRADAGTQIGTGHVMRCLALAQAWQRAGGNAIFTMAMETPALEARLKSEGMEVVRLSVEPGSKEDAYQTAVIAKEKSASWVIADGYCFDSEYQKAIKSCSLNLLFIDDMGLLNHYFADIVLNQNMHAHERLYLNREPYTRLLLSPRYALLRHEFLKWKKWQRAIPKTARKILVTLGGSDPKNVTLKVIKALKNLSDLKLEVKVIAGSENPNITSIEEALHLSPFTSCLLSNAGNMPSLMKWADVSVSAAGSTCWEIAFMGLPNIVVALAQNQVEVARSLKETGLAISLGWYASLNNGHVRQPLLKVIHDARRRQKMSARGRNIVDGNGASRVVNLLKEDHRWQ